MLLIIRRFKETGFLILKSWLVIDIPRGYRKIECPLHVGPATGAVAKQLADECKTREQPGYYDSIQAEIAQNRPALVGKRIC